MKREVTYAGHSAVFISLGDFNVAIDPWLEGNPSCPPDLKNPKKLDLIILTHGHSDHASDTPRIAKLTGAKVAATWELANIMISQGVSADKIIYMNKGGSVQEGNLKIALTNAFHSSSFDIEGVARYAGEPCGVVLQHNELVIYHAGDTALFGDMKLIGDFYKPHISFLPIGDRFTMGPKEAAHAAKLLGSRINIPIHYRTFDLLSGTFVEFQKNCSELGIECLELAPGKSLEL